MRISAWSSDVCSSDLPPPSQSAAVAAISPPMTDYVTITADAPMGRTGAIKLFDEPSFEGMRRAGRLAAEVLDMLVPHVVPGVETQALDEMIRDQDRKSTRLNSSH